MDYNSLITAIPAKWKANIIQYGDKASNENAEDIFLGKSCYNVDCLNSKTIYNILVNRIVTVPTAIDRWIDEFPFLNDHDFTNFFLLPNFAATNTKMQVFQFKIIHRIVACTSNLKKWGITDHNTCSQCGTIETIEHLFFYCNEVHTLWKRIENWLKYTLDIDISLSVVDIILGVPFPQNDNLLLNLNHIILMTKWYIYKTRLEKQNLFFLHCLKELTTSISMEYYIAGLHLETGQPNKWQILYDVL